VTYVAPQVAGRIIRVLVNDNQEVKAGDLLAEINPPDFEVKLEQAKAALAEAESRLEQTKAQEAVAAANVEAARADVAAAEASAATAAADLKRYQSLNPQSVSRQQLDQAAASAKTTAAQLQAAQRKLAAAEAQKVSAATDVRAAAAGVHSAEESVRQANINLGYTKITARVDGWVTNKSVAVGDYVQQGQQLLAIVPYDVWVTANFKETQLDRMFPGQPVTVAIDAYADHDLHGTVQSIQAGSGARLQPPPAGERDRQLREGRPARPGQDRLRQTPERARRQAPDGAGDERGADGEGAVSAVKHEVRSTKPETNSNPGRKKWESGGPVSILLHFRFGACFGFRASDFGFLGHPAHDFRRPFTSPRLRGRTSGGQPVDHRGRRLDGDVHGGARHVDRERLPAAHRREPCGGGRREHLGADQLPRLQRDHPAGQRLSLHRRRPQAVLHRLRGAVHDQLAAVRGWRRRSAG